MAKSPLHNAELYGKSKANHRRLADNHAASDLLWLYLGGPMMWQKDFNFPVFDEAREELEWMDEVDLVFSPADNDRQQGFEGTGLSGQPGDLEGVKFNRREALRQDMEWIALHSDGMVVLPGWETSDGTRAEVAFHQGLHLPVWRLADFLAHGTGAPQLAQLQLPDAPPAVLAMERVRQFESGADRDTDEHKIDPEGALSPVVLQRYAEYMREHSIRQDGSRRSSDNWQKGMDLDVYASSAWRHFLQFWMAHRGYEPLDDDGKLVPIQEALCGSLFNLMGYLHEVMRDAESPGGAG
jgi:hypothetical protein